MKCFFFGSKSLTWRHLPVMRLLAIHAIGSTRPPLDQYLAAPSSFGFSPLDEDESLLLVHEDVMPSDKVPGAIGASKLAEVACMEAWPEYRLLRRLRPDPDDQDPVATARAKLVKLKPDRAYCLHTDLDSSRDSRAVADLLRQAKIPIHYIRVTAAGAVLEVQER